MNIVEKKERALRQKQEALDNYIDGKMSLIDLYRASKLKDYKSTGLIKFWELLSSKPGWSKSRARSALMRHDINPDMLLRSVKSESMLARVESLIDMASDRWEQAPRMPEGYPYGARSSLILKVLAEEGMPLQDFFAKLQARPELESVGDVEDSSVQSVNYVSEDDGGELEDIMFGDEDVGIDDEDEVSGDSLYSESFGSDAMTDEDIADELFG